MEPNDLLAEAFRHHGRPEARIDGGWVVMPGYPPARASAYPFETGQKLFNSQIDVEIALDDGRVLAESVGGLGLSEEAALVNGFEKFAGNSFHSILCAFYDYPVDEQIEYVQWTIRGEQWEVFKGPLGVMHVAGNGPVEQPEFEKIAPANLMEFIDELIKSQPLDSDTHWIRFFYAQQDGSPMPSEVLWDNEIWEEGQRRMSALAWPRFPGFTSLRNFVLLRKKGAPKQRGSGENARDIERALSEMLAYCNRNRNTDDEAIRDYLTHAGFTPAFTDRVIAFGPPCFSSLLLRESFPTEYIIISGGVQGPPIKLITEPVFAVGRRYAMEIGRDSERRDAFLSMAGRCAIFKAVNQALHNGAKLENLAFSPLLMMLDRAEKDEPPPPQPSAEKQKPWWQLW